MSNKDSEPTPIDADTLGAVTGGAASPDQIAAALQSIQASIKSMGANNNNNVFQQFLPFLIMAMGGGGMGGSCPCGCGMRGCRR
jgi:hypothetical protein